MKKNKRLLNVIIITISAIIIVLLFFVLFFKNKDIVFSINNKNIKIKIGETKKIEYQLSDSNLDINWSSSNEVIGINSNGEITANGYGKVIITGSIIKDNEKISDSCIVESYTGIEGISVDSVDVADGYLLMKPNSEFPLPFTINPTDAYITSLEYHSGDENVVIVSNDKIISGNIGSTIISVLVNKKIAKDIMVIVSDNNKDNSIVKEIDKVIFDDDNITMEMGDTKVLYYDVNPKNGYIDTIEWFSSNEEVAKVSEGVLEAVNVGETEIKIVINNKVSSTMNVIVKSSNSNIKIEYNPKTTIRVGETTKILASLDPITVNDNIKYTSSNPSVARVDNGVITGYSAGSTLITLTISNGKSKAYTINVLPQKGSLSGSANFWGYKSLNAKTPIYADKSFFQRLAANGIGLLQNNNYIITTAEGRYSYDISTNQLSINGKTIKVRIYYPTGEDLSTLNTLTYMGGRGETNFGGAFEDIRKNPSIVKSAGIIILLAEGNNTSFDGDSGAYTTLFVKAITKQKTGVKNSILGFSDGAHKVMHASNKMVYDRIIVFSGYTDGVSSLTNAKNSEVFFIIAPSDGNYTQAQTALRQMKESGFRNVTIVSSGSDMSKKFSDSFLVINPGSLMKNGHLTENVMRCGIIEYAND